MRVESRVIRLEREQAKVEKVCAVCGAPETIVMRVIHTTHDRPLPKCSGCGRTVTDDGRPVGSPYKRVICAQCGPDFVSQHVKPMP